GHVIASFGEESGKLPYTVFMAKQSLFEDDPDTIKKFTKAIYTAQQWVEKNSPEKIAKVIQPYFEDANIDILTDSMERYKNQESVATDPILEVDEWNNLKDIMDEAGELPDEVSYEDLVNTDIAKKVMEE